MKIAINGAGIGGPTLAYWLQRSGHEVLLIEQSSGLRTGGYAIDFWGLGYDIAEKMGLRPRVEELGFQVKEMRYVDRDGRTEGGFSLDVFREMTGDRFTEIQRSDLAAALYQAVDGKVETLFGDSVAKITDAGDEVRLEFDHAGPRTVDLVIGADGLHSRVRQLAFGPQSEFEVPLGYHVAAFQLEGYQPRDEMIAMSHAAPGRQISRVSLRGDMTLCLFVFRDEYLSSASPSNDSERKAALKEAFAGVGGECPGMLEAMDDVSGIYFDRVSQIRMEKWAVGRTALLGDAAACASLLAGEGTGLAMTEAYVLAGELHRSGGDYPTAFARYQDLLMPFLRRKQRSALKLASSFAPKTAFGITCRNQLSRLLKVPFLARLLIGRVIRDEIELPDYRF